MTAVQLNRSGENFNRTASSFFDDSSAIAQSDRLQWFATFVAICRRKTPDEIALDGVQFGTHKFIPLKARFQGRDASGHHDLLLRNIEGTQRWVNNYLNFSMDNFVVREHGSLADIIEHESAQHELDDGVNDNSNLGLH